MRLLNRLGKAFWVGILLIGLSVAVWFVAPLAKSCVTDFNTQVCETTGVVVLNLIGLVLFAIGGILLFVAGGLASEVRRRRGRSGDTR
jgi:hypothetical protein